MNPLRDFPKRLNEICFVFSGFQSCSESIFPKPLQLPAKSKQLLTVKVGETRNPSYLKDFLQYHTAADSLWCVSMEGGFVCAAGLDLWNHRPPSVGNHKGHEGTSGPFPLRKKSRFKNRFYLVVSTLAKCVANNREPIAVRACACGFHSRLALNKQPLNGIKLLAMHYGI